MARPRKGSRSDLSETPHSLDLRIIGGRFRGRKLRYHGDPVTRPMKHRVREAIFNLVSTDAKGRHAIDLFSGTGALGLEALSRGSVGATFIERHVPTSRVVAENIASLDVEEQAQLLTMSAFLWAKRDLPRASMHAGKVQTAKASAFRRPAESIAWLVFCSPPYAFFVEQLDAMLGLIHSVMDAAPPNSIVVVESDERFDFDKLPGGRSQTKRDGGWDVRRYPPAVIGVWRK